MELLGPWTAIEATEELRRDFHEPDLAEDDWRPITVPGHWRSSPDFANSDGPLLYRTHFDGRAGEDDTRDWLILDGLFYQGDAFLDGSYLGDTEGYFFGHTFEITEQMADRAEHVLAIETTCSPEREPRRKRNLTGVFQHWDCLDPHWNPGGIWRPVRLERTGPVRIRRLRTVCIEATEERATLRFSANLDSADPRSVTVRTAVGSIDQAFEQPLAAGPNEIEWTVSIDRPELWWPHTLGGQPLYDVAVEILVDPDQATVSHRREVTTGLRSVEMRNWTMSINGERLFIKGSNLGPSRQDIALATAEDFARDLHLAKTAGLDLIRVHAHVSRPEMYEEADKAGMLLWQDMPLQWCYARSIRKQASRQAAKLVTTVGHHPSVVLWCGHNEPFAVDDTDSEELATTSGMIRTGLRILAQQQLPTWNKTILDSSIKRSIEKTDGSRPVIPHSGIWPHFPKWDGTDSHTYFGWYHGNERQFPTFTRVIPRMARFLSEFGAQAVPNNDDFMNADEWPDLNWERLADEHALQKIFFDRYVPPGDFDTYDEWKNATQQYQATVVKHHIEHLRRIKYRPTGGFCQFSFADGADTVTWSVLDKQRSPKAGYDALTEACRPVIVVADRLPETVKAGKALALDVHIVSDLRTAFSQAKVQAILRWPGGSHQWGWAGDIPADDCARVGTIQFVVPNTSGPISLDLGLSCGSIRATNRYESEVA